MRSQSDTAGGMECPVCHVPLAIGQRQGVVIERCPQCRGVWLDRGALDVIVSRVAPPGSEAPATPQPAPAPMVAPASQPQGSQPLHQGQARDPWDAGGLSHGGYGHGGDASSGDRRRHWLADLFE